MLTETTLDVYASGSDDESSDPAFGTPYGVSINRVGVAGCMPGHEGTRPAAAVVGN